MLIHTELKKGVQFLMEGQPYEVLESSTMVHGRGNSTVPSRVKNMKTGKIVPHTFHTGETFEEADISKLQMKYLYNHRGAFVFCEASNPSKRMEFTQEQLGDGIRFIKPNEVVEGLVFANEIINVAFPIKVQLKVTEAPPGFRGNTVQGGTKTVKLETGTTLDVPLFVNEGDVIEINTDTGEYSRRA